MLISVSTNLKCPLGEDNQCIAARRIESFKHPLDAESECIAARQIESSAPSGLMRALRCSSRPAAMRWLVVLHGARGVVGGGLGRTVRGDVPKATKACKKAKRPGLRKR